jgi:hypothetical protein
MSPSLRKNKSEKVETSVKRVRARVVKNPEIAESPKKRSPKKRLQSEILLEQILEHKDLLAQHELLIHTEDVTELPKKHDSVSGDDCNAQHSHTSQVHESVSRNAGAHTPLDAITSNEVIKSQLMHAFREEAHAFYRDKSLTRKHLIQAFACLVILVSVGVYISPKTKAESAVFYPNTCLGGWVNATHATGIPETESNEFENAFTADNSALLESGVGSDVYCGGFTGEFDKNTKPTKVLVTISWAKAVRGQATTTLTGESFTSHSLQILDAATSTVVDFASTEATSTEHLLEATTSPLLDIDGGSVQGTSTFHSDIIASTSDASSIPSGVPSVKSQDENERVETSTTSAQVLPDPQDGTSVLDAVTKSVTGTENVIQSPEVIVQPIAPLPVEPVQSSSNESKPLSLVAQFSRFFAMQFGGLVHAQEASSEVVPPTDSVPVVPEVHTDSVSIPVESVVVPTATSLDGAGEKTEVGSVLFPQDVSSDTLGILATSSDNGAVLATTTENISEFLASSTVVNVIDQVKASLSEIVTLPNISSGVSSKKTSNILHRDASSTSSPFGDVSLGLLSTSTKETVQSVFIEDIDVLATSTGSSGSSMVTLASNEEDDSASNFLQISYTFDGVVWMNLARVNEESIKYRTFEIPVSTTTSWADLSAIQIKVTPIPRLEPTPAVFLDGMKLEVLYETPGELRAHPDFTRDSILKDKSDDNVRVVNIINSDTNNREIWYTTIREQAGFGISPGTWVKLDMGDGSTSYRLIEIYGRYLFWIDEVAKMMWVTSLEKASNDGTQLKDDATTSVTFVKDNGEVWILDYWYKDRKGLIHIQE